MPSWINQRSIGADQTTVVALPKPEAIRLLHVRLEIDVEVGHCLNSEKGKEGIGNQENWSGLARI